VSLPSQQAVGPPDLGGEPHSHGVVLAADPRLEETSTSNRGPREPTGPDMPLQGSPD